MSEAAAPGQAPALKRLTPVHEQWFFGYYDVPAVSADGRLHLAHRVGFRDRLPRPEDEAGLFTLDLASGAARRLATTRAWNFQQGSLLQWVGGTDRTVFYNRCNGAAGYRGVLHNIAADTVREIDRPLANLSRDGRWGLCVNFARLFDFRPGYGYGRHPDAFAGDLHPADDGVFLADLASGTSRLVLSLARIHAAIRHLSPLADGKLLINHITFNPGATRFVALVRNFPPPGGPAWGWGTTVLTADRDGGDLRILVPHGYASHYHWRDDGRIAFWCDGPQGHQLYEIEDRTAAYHALDVDFFRQDGHCSYSPDRTRLLYDSYPDAAAVQRLFVYDLARRRGAPIAALRAEKVTIADIRCDLHPRWFPDGRRFSIDSTHEGERAIYAAEAAP